MSTIYLPATSPDQWLQFPAEPVNRGRTGYSARTLAPLIGYNHLPLGRHSS